MSKSLEVLGKLNLSMKLILKDNKKLIGILYCLYTPNTYLVHYTLVLNPYYTNCITKFIQQYISKFFITEILQEFHKQTYRF